MRERKKTTQVMRYFKSIIRLFTYLKKKCVNTTNKLKTPKPAPTNNVWCVCVCVSFLFVTAFSHIPKENKYKIVFGLHFGAQIAFFPYFFFLSLPLICNFKFQCKSHKKRNY